MCNKSGITWNLDDGFQSPPFPSPSPRLAVASVFISIARLSVYFSPLIPSKMD